MIPKATRAKPPITPPTMAPIGVLDLLSGVDAIEGDVLEVTAIVDVEAAFALEDVVGETR
jgi:hypothetical protein